MALFEKKLTLSELEKRLDDFDNQTDALQADLEKMQTRVSAGLARGDDLTKLLNAAAALRVQLDARPLAKQALEREYRRARRAEDIKQVKVKISEDRRWGDQVVAAGEKIAAALKNLETALGGWRALEEQAAGRGPSGMSWQMYRDYLRLIPFAKALPDLVSGQKKAAQLEEIVMREAKLIAREAAAGAEGRLAKLVHEEAEDPDPLPELETAPARA